MRIVWILLGLAGIAYTGFGVVQFFDILSESNPASAGGGSRIVAGVLPVLLGVIATLIGFKKALGTKPPSTGPQDTPPEA